MKFIDVAHFYIGCQMQSHKGSNWTLRHCDFDDDSEWKYSSKPLLLSLEDMTEEDFKEFATSIMQGKNDQMAFDFGEHEWKAAAYDTSDYEEIPSDSDLIIATEESDPSDVLMLSVIGKRLSYGWLNYQETFCDCELIISAKWLHFLTSKGYDVFGLIESGQAIRKTK